MAKGHQTQEYKFKFVHLFWILHQQLHKPQTLCFLSGLDLATPLLELLIRNGFGLTSLPENVLKKTQVSISTQPISVLRVLDFHPFHVVFLCEASGTFTTGAKFLHGQSLHICRFASPIERSAQIWHLPPTQHLPLFCLDLVRGKGTP